jgi:type I restriction enzyme R subunit
VQQATEQYEGFGLFLRAMTAPDYEAAAIAFAGVRSSQTFTPQQDDHLELLIEVLAKNGSAKAADLCESPFTLRARGPKDLFTDAQIDAIEAVLQDIRTRVQPRAS